jgi:hypothetical protein
MGRIIKWLFILCVLGFVGLVVYAYLGPFFGADFSPKQTAVTQQIELHEK